MKLDSNNCDGRGPIIVSVMFAFVIAVLGWITTTAINSKEGLAKEYLDKSVQLNQSMLVALDELLRV